MGVPLSREEFREMFRTFRHTAFRLETKDRYNEPYTGGPLSRYLAGQPIDFSFLDEWTGKVRAAVAEDKSMSRVRIVTEPHTDYVRYSMHVARVNVSAGEDIRYLARHRAHELGIPDEDYWLFDSTWAAVLLFGEDGRVTGHELLEEPAEVVRRCQWRDAAWHYAVVREEYAAEHGVT